MNIRIYGNNNLATIRSLAVCFKHGVTPVAMMVGREYQEDTAICMVDANYHETGYPIIFDGLTYIGGVKELKKYLAENSK